MNISLITKENPREKKMVCALRPCFNLVFARQLRRFARRTLGSGRASHPGRRRRRCGGWETGLSGPQIVQQYCSACHMAGVAGAPKLGDKAAWKPRIAQGKETLVKHAIAGLKAMPPRGTCNELQRRRNCFCCRRNDQIIFGEGAAKLLACERLLKCACAFVSFSPKANFSKAGSSKPFGCRFRSPAKIFQRPLRAAARQKQNAHSSKRKKQTFT